MHILGIGLHILVAIYFAVHAIRSNQGLYWLFILFMFPLLGSIVYGVAIWLPEMRQSYTARRAGSAVRRVLDPNRELREAREAHDHTATVANRTRLGQALLASGQAEEAVPLLRAAAQGLYADDPDVLAQLARAELESGDAAAARDRLDALIAAHPNYRSPTAHLTYARAVAACGDQAKAHEEFEVLVDSFPGLEARARYARLLSEWGENERAQALAAESLAKARGLPRHSRDLDRDWIKQLQELAK
ncbi:MAG: tetratricopeptide repeat protein [Pseudomonadota bacterium]